MSIEAIVLFMMIAPLFLFLLYIELSCYVDRINKIGECMLTYFTANSHWEKHILDSVEDAYRYIGYKACYNPVEMPSFEGTLTSVNEENNTVEIVDDYKRINAPYWNVRVYYQTLNKTI